MSFFSPAYGDSIRETVQKPVVKRLLKKEHSRVLDAGSGSGFYTSLARTKSKITLDLSFENAKATSKLPATKAVKGDVQTLPFKEKSFDAVLCLEVLEHLKEDKQALREIKRALKKDGQLVLSVPLRPAPITDTAHVREGYLPEGIKGMLEREGFKIEREEYCMLVFSRLAFKLLNFCEQRLGFRPPEGTIKLISWLDCLCPGDKRRWKPYDIVILARRN